VWAYHDWHSKGGQEVTAFVRAMEEELGRPDSLEDFERKAQLLNYVSHRAMFEGYNSHLWNPNSGRLMWMTHPAWPSMVWQMYGSDYSTHASFYAIKKACEPLHVQLSLPGLETAVINNTARPSGPLRLSALIFSIGGEELFKREESLSVPPGAVTESFSLVMPEQATDGVVFIKLLLRDQAGAVVSENFYWYASKKAAYRQLDEMAVARVDCSALRRTVGAYVRVEIELANQNPGIALAAEVSLRDSVSKARVLPAYASDNFISLLPGEKHHLTIEVPANLSDKEMEINLSGWNVRAITVPVRSAR
jgi:hypothetical protein